ILMSKIQPHKIFQIYQDRRRIYTKSIVPGYTPFQEIIVKEGREEYRDFDPRRSKLAAAIVKGCTNTGIRKDDVILYLGASHGYTCSFVSDIVGEGGIIFGIDPAPRVMRDLVFLSEERKNIVPMLADANHPEEYLDKVCLADIVYQDIAQRNQSDIFIRNCNLFLKKGGYGLLAVKARSIDIKKKSNVLFNEIRRELEKVFTVIDFRNLEPFERDHCMIIIKK
ncbi:MAG: fibrillarin-like rRNA/tRNA 2'-O-methyltransferase, partial [Candidatus Woesearchaeota archaeon]